MEVTAAPDHQQPSALEYQSLTQPASLEIFSNQEARIADPPQLLALYDAYRSSYNDVTTSNAARLQHAKTFAFALLAHYFPESEGFRIAPCSPGPVAKHGISLILSDGDGSDIDPFKPPHKARRGQRLNPKQREENAAAKSQHSLILQNHRQKWHNIAATNIAAFAVQRQIEDSDMAPTQSTQSQAYTYLVIMIDQFESAAQFSGLNDLQRCDVLTDLLCREGRLQQGHGILLHGPLIEIYTFDRGAEFTAGDQEQDTEPKMEVATDASGSEKLVCDTRIAGLTELDDMLKQALGKEVTHVQGVIQGPADDVASGITNGHENHSTICAAEGEDVDAEGEDDDMGI